MEFCNTLLDAILAVDGVDAIFIGPYDLSQALGRLGQIDAPEVIATIEEIIAKAKSYKKTVGIFADMPEAAHQWRSMGAGYLAYSVDMGLFYEKCKQIVNMLAQR